MPEMTEMPETPTRLSSALADAISESVKFLTVFVGGDFYQYQADSDSLFVISETCHDAMFQLASLPLNAVRDKESVIIDMALSVELRMAIGQAATLLPLFQNVDSEVGTMAAAVGEIDEPVVTDEMIEKLEPLVVLIEQVRAGLLKFLSLAFNLPS